jgi:iron(III) transport system ATP-binding protein
MILELKNVSLSFDRPVLKRVAFSLKEGQIISIVGKSGAGKTSLLRIMAGFLEPDSGEALFEGRRIQGPSTKLLPGHDEIQLVNQDFKLDDFHTVEENIKLQILHLPEKVRDHFSRELLELMGLTDHSGKQARYLSGGEQQRLAIARVLAKEPKIILLDEPFSHLDALLRNRLINYLLELRRLRGTSFVLVSHDGSEVLGLSDVIYFMKNGVLTKKGSPLKVYYRSGSLEEARIFGPINSVRIGDDRFIFRPDEYLEDEELGLPLLKLKFIESLFTGPVYENHFITDHKEKVVLYSFNRMDHVGSISIRRKDQKS